MFYPLNFEQKTGFDKIRLLLSDKCLSPLGTERVSEMDFSTDYTTITDRLEQGIADLFNSERFKEYLNVMSKFHNYSFNNTVLIALQKPDASLVMGFNAWKGKGIERNVKKGEQGIRIFAPAPYKIKTEQEKIDPDT